MPCEGFMLILGAIFGIISAVIIYAFDWIHLNSEIDEMKRINSELLTLLKEERAINELLGYQFEED